MSSDTKLIGFDDLNFYLNNFADKVEKRILKTSLSAGAIVIKKQAKKNAPRRTGTLRKAIKHKRLKGNRASVRIFVDRGKKSKNDGWYAHIIEGGARAHKILPRKGKGISIGGRVLTETDHPGIKARPFMKPAFESKYKEAIISAGKRLRVLIEKELSK